MEFKLNICVYLIFTCLYCISWAKKSKDENKPDWAKKDIRDYSEADLERLLDQWEEDEEPLEEDELPEHLRPQPQIDFSQIDMSNPENILKMSKKGRTLMVFVSVSGDPTREEAESLTKLWQTSLWNSHIQAERGATVMQRIPDLIPGRVTLEFLHMRIVPEDAAGFLRYLVADDRSIFLFKDGSQAWDAKDYLVEQERCKEVVIENKSYYGKHTPEGKEEELKKVKVETKSKKKKRNEEL